MNMPIENATCSSYMFIYLLTVWYEACSNQTKQNLLCRLLKRNLSWDWRGHTKKKKKMDVTEFDYSKSNDNQQQKKKYERGIKWVHI